MSGKFSFKLLKWWVVSSLTELNVNRYDKKKYNVNTIEHFEYRFP